MGCPQSCLNCLNSGDSQPVEQPCVRPFTISPAKPKLAKDSRLYQDQNISCTAKGKNKICAERVTINQLQLYVEKKLSSELVNRTALDQYNTQTTKIIQNLYVTSFGGLKAKTIKNYRINLLLNASIDLPIVEVPNAESIRVPITDKEPDLIGLYLGDVADKIHENYTKNGYTLLYCHDGTRNSIALALGYLLKYTDLMLSEALLHLRYTRKSFDFKEGDLGGFRPPLEQFAKKLNKNDFDQLEQSGYGKRSDKKYKKYKSKNTE